MKFTPLALLLFLPAFPQDDVRSKLDQRISIDYRGGLPKGLALLRDRLGVPIDFDARVSEKMDVEREVTLKLKNVKGSSAVAWFARLYGLTHGIRGGRVVLALSEGFETRILDLAGVLRPAYGECTPRVELNEGQPGVSVTIQEPKESTLLLEEIADWIRECIDPGTWEGAASLETLPGSKLLVTHRPETLQRIDRFLEVLRRATPATVTIEADVVEADDALLAMLRSLGGGSLGPEETKNLRETMKGPRRDPKAFSFSIPCLDGQPAHGMAMGQKLTFQNVPGFEVIGIYSDASVLAVRPSVSTDGRTIRTQIRLQASRATDHQSTALGGKVDLPETALVRLETYLTIPNGGSALFLLPRRCEEASRPQVLWLRGSATAPGPIGPVDSADPSAKELWKQLDAVRAMDFSIKEARVEELVAFLRESTGINFVVDPEVDPHLKLTIHAEQIKPRVALETLLSPHGIELVPFAEAFLVGPNAGPGGLPIFVESLRDLSAQPFDARVGDEEGARQEWAPDDFANLIRTSVAKDDWGDERAIGVTADGLLIVRQTPTVMVEVRKFLALLRSARDRRVDLRIDLFELKESEAPADGLLSAEDVDKLLAAARKTGGPGAESMHVRGPTGVRLGMDWRRSRAYVRDYNEEKTEEKQAGIVLDTMVAASHVGIRAEAGDGGVTVRLDLSEMVFDGIEVTKIGKYELQTPLLGIYGAKTVFSVAPGKVQAVKLSGTREREGERTVRVVLVRAESSR